MCAKLTFLARCKKRAGLIDLTPTTKKPGRPSIGWRRKGGGGGDNICGRGTISASGICPWGTISASGLCPGGQNLQGDRICSDTGMFCVEFSNIYMGQCPAESPFWLVFQVFKFFDFP